VKCNRRATHSGSSAILESLKASRVTRRGGGEDPWLDARSLLSGTDGVNPRAGVGIFDVLSSRPDRSLGSAPPASERRLAAR
jgi:hypothetical protein